LLTVPGAGPRQRAAAVRASIVPVPLLDLVSASPELTSTGLGSPPPY